MAIKIDKIKIVNSGPLIDFDYEIPSLTLIYGKNERGKTTIVENLIKSVFDIDKETSRDLRARSFSGGAKVIISGFDNKNNLEFSPDYKQKIDDILIQKDNTLPKSLFRLLYIKGAESGIDGAGVTKSRIKELLSRQDVYRRVKSQIPNETGYTSLENGIITGNKQGANKTHLDTSHELGNLKSLSEKYYQSPIRLEIQRFEYQKSNIEKEKQELIKAKRYYAFKLKQEIDKLRNEIVYISQDDLYMLSQKISEYEKVKQECFNLQKEIEGYKDLDYLIDWLEISKKIYNENRNKQKRGLATFLLLLSLVALLAVGVSIFVFPFLAQVIVTATGFVSLSIFTILWFLNRKGKIDLESNELMKIREDFYKKFNRELNSEADFDTEKESLKRQIEKNNYIKKDYEDKAFQIKGLKIEIDNLFNNLGIDVTEDLWKETLRNLKIKRGSLEKNLSEIQQEFSSLNIKENDFRRDPANTEFSQNELDEIDNKIRVMEEAIQSKNNDWVSLKDKLSDYIGSTLNLSDEEISERIEAKILEYKNEISKNLSLMIAGHCVKDVLEEFIKEEDSEIEEIINDKSITDLIYKFTKRYNKIRFDGEELVLNDGDGRSFKLSELSTGAREQVLLALRVGIARKLTGENSLFFILDDAFQYSDWERRDYLIEETKALVEEGWQVLYLTMDDDIKSRFQKICGKKLKTINLQE